MASHTSADYLSANMDASPTKLLYVEPYMLEQMPTPTILEVETDFASPSSEEVGVEVAEPVKPVKERTMAEKVEAAMLDVDESKPDSHNARYGYNPLSRKIN